MKKSLIIFISLIFIFIGASRINIQKLFDDGMNALALGNYEQGIIKLRTVYLERPSGKLAEKARYYVGYFAPDIFQQKVEYMAFLKAYPHSAFRENIYFNLGLNYYVTGNYKDSEKFFEKYLWDYPTGKFAENVNFYLAIIAYNNREYSLFETKLRKIINNKHSKFKDNSIFLLKRYYAKKGILEKVKQLDKMISNTFPLTIRSQNEHYFTIQLGAFKKKSGAQRLEKSLLKKKLNDITIEKIGDYYKIYCGIFLTKSECNYYYNKLKKMGYKGRIIEKDK